MSDAPGADPSASPEPRAPTRQRPVFDRAFPGPSPQDPRFQSRLDAIARAAERRRQHAEQRDQRRSGDRAGSASAAPAPAPAGDGDELALLRDAVHEQTEVLRALLEADVAIRDDARATAQNSRTFAVAGTVIAFFTLIATVVTVVIAFAVR